MAPRPHAETTSDATEPTHGALHFRAHLKSQRCRENQRWSAKQTETHQQWHPTRICSVAPALQCLHSRLNTNQLEEVRICRRHCLAQSSSRREHDWRDMSILSTWLKQWRLKLSEAKTVSATFHLNKREAKRELNVNISGRQLTCQRTPTYLGVKNDRTLTYRQHLTALRGHGTNCIDSPPCWHPLSLGTMSASAYTEN